MIAVLCQKVVCGALKFVGNFVDDLVDFVLGGEREAVEDFCPEGAARGNGLGSCPVYSSNSALVVTTICVFSTVDHHACMQQGGSYCPQDRGESARL